MSRGGKLSKSIPETQFKTVWFPNPFAAKPEHRVQKKVQHAARLRGGGQKLFGQCPYTRTTSQKGASLIKDQLLSSQNLWQLFCFDKVWVIRRGNL